MNMNMCIISFVKEYKTKIINVKNYLNKCTVVTDKQFRSILLIRVHRLRAKTGYTEQKVIGFVNGTG